MEYESLSLLAKNKWKGIFFTGILVGAFSFFLLVFFSKHYKVTTDFLVVQTGVGQTQDFYSMLKSSEYLGKVFVKSIYSEKFIEAVVETGVVDTNFLPRNPKDRLDVWEKMVSTGSNPDVGTLYVEVYGDNDRDALHVAQAVGKVITEKNMLFRSGDEKSVEVRTLSGPIVETNPDVKRMSMVVLSGFFFGIFSSLFYFLFKTGRKIHLSSLESIETKSAQSIQTEMLPKDSRINTLSNNQEVNNSGIYTEKQFGFFK